MSRKVTLSTVLDDIQNGNRRVLGRVLTLIENNDPIADTILDILYPHTGKALIIGITGAPGTGKSSLVNALALHVRRQQNLSVGIVAVDPSSPFSRGAVLGDRIRMRDLSGDKDVFIRSMASRGSLGGLAHATIDVVRVLDAAGFDVVIIETVGAGQSEVAIASTANCTLVIEAPGLGDDIQATKAGILEIADVLVVNKADHPAANKTAQTLRSMLDLGHRLGGVGHHGAQLLPKEAPPELDFWHVPVLKTIALQNEGIAEVYEAIVNHQAYLRESGLDHQRHALQLETELANRLQHALLTQLLDQLAPEKLQDLLKKLEKRELTPAQATQQLINYKKN